MLTHDESEENKFRNYLLKNMRTYLIILAVVSPSKPGTQTKVCKFEMAILVYQYIVRLDIPVNRSNQSF